MDPAQKGIDLSGPSRKKISLNGSWEMMNSNVIIGDKYKGGHEETGDLTRKRDKSKDVKIDVPFDPNGKRDVWKTRNHVSLSLRTNVDNKILGISPKFEQESGVHTLQRDKTIPFDCSPRYNRKDMISDSVFDF